MTNLDLRGVAETGRLVRPSDAAYGFEGGDTTASAARRSTWQQALELSGLYIQFSTDNTAWSDTAADEDTHFRIASGTAKPSNTSSRWSAGIALGGDIPDVSGLVDDVTFADPHCDDHLSGRDYQHL